MKNKKLFIGLGIAAVVILAIELVLYAITGAFGRTALSSLFSDDSELKKTKTEVIWPEITLPTTTNNYRITMAKYKIIREDWFSHEDSTEG